MLVLTRKPLQSFRICNDTGVTVLEVNRNQVKIGIRAPDDVLILRTELKEKQYGNR